MREREAGWWVVKCVGVWAVACAARGRSKGGMQEGMQKGPWRVLRKGRGDMTRRVT